MSVRGLVLPALLAAALAAGCGGGDGDEPAGPTTTPGAKARANAPPSRPSPDVDMNDALQFDPETTTVSAGHKLEWRNVGNIAHTVTTDPDKVADPRLVEVPDGAKAWDSGLIERSQSFSRTFDEPGTYRYVCIPHEGARMIGTVVVKP